MSSAEVRHAVSLANEIGKAGFVVCRYEWSRRHGRFEFGFYRHGNFMGSTVRITEVVKKAERLVGVTK